MPLKKWFLEVGCCPDCSGRIVLKETKDEKDGDCVTGMAACEQCAAKYPIVDGIPVLHSTRKQRKTP